MKHNFKELFIWQKAMNIVNLTYDFTKTLPGDERFNLIQQMNRSSCSMPSNIAEGCGKRTHKHFAEYLSTALSSGYELETQFLICKMRGYGNAAETENALRELNEVQKMIFSFRDKILAKPNFGQKLKNITKFLFIG